MTENITCNPTSMMSDAIFSEDGKYRYALWRFWNYPAVRDNNAKAVMFILANSSTAGKFTDDPTVIKCCHYGQRWGYDGVYLANLCALVETHWMASPSLEGRIGELCDYYLSVMRNSSHLHVATWGFMGKNYPERAKQVKAMFPKLYYLELSKDGVPKHPLYLKANLKPVLWE